jgi:hypothetical protein
LQQQQQIQQQIQQQQMQQLQQQQQQQVSPWIYVSFFNNTRSKSTETPNTRWITFSPKIPEQAPWCSGAFA